MSRSSKLLSTLARIAGALLFLGAALAPGSAGQSSVLAEPPVAPEAPQNQAITLSVISARDELNADLGRPVIKGEPVVGYKWMISVDNTGDPLDPNPNCLPYLDPPVNSIPNPDYTVGCEWPGIRTVPGWAPVYTQGTEAQLNETVNVTLPPGKYLISVTAPDFKIDGEHFTIPVTGPVSQLVTVQMHPLPLPPATMVIKVFEDRAMTNGQFDVPSEEGQILSGFRASLFDTIGEITNDLFGNPICTIYEHNPDGSVQLDPGGAPVIQTLGDGCWVDPTTGLITIPNIGPLRYDVLVIPPDGEEWIQTTTLEGSQGWDTWLQEAGTGLDNEFVIAGEPFPWTVFGFVRPTNGLQLPPGAEGGTGGVRGTVMATAFFSPAQGGLPYQGDIWAGFNGNKILGPIPKPWLSLNDLQNGDQAIWVGQGDQNGAFEITGLADGNYLLTYWDEQQHYILDFKQFAVSNGQITDIGVRFLTGWFTHFYGTVFHDYNENGKQEPGEPGIPNYLVVLKDRDNTEIDRMSITSLTDPNGKYSFPKAYPMGSWMVLEAYNDLYRTTGITFQAENQPQETTILGGGVDVGVLPILGQPGRLDWGVKFYDEGTNGGIVGTVFYDTGRNEDDARYAAVEPFAPGIPNLTVNLYATVRNPSGTFATNSDGSLVKGPLLNSVLTETFTRAKNCIARDVKGDPVDFPALPPSEGDFDCLEAPIMGTQFDTTFATLDGNYGFGEIIYAPDGTLLPVPEPLPAGAYLVEVEVPLDPVFGKPLFQVTREEDLNVFDGDTWVPQIPPPACAGALHVVDVAGLGTDGYPDPYNGTGFSIPVENPALAEIGTQFEGRPMPYCNVKLVELETGRSIAPTFNFFTPVPIPGKWKGYIIDDLNISVDPNDLFFGEKPGLANMPIGIYDYVGRLVHTVLSDRHGVYEVLLPSTDTYNAPTPSGMLANVYYIYGNDPGVPGALNPSYNPAYRSIGTSFEIYPGVIVPSDLAPTTNWVTILAPDSQTAHPAACNLEATTPQIFAVDKPFGAAGSTITIRGLGFGAVPGVIRLGSFTLGIVSWSDRQIVATVPSWMSPGQHQLTITAANRQKTVNGLTFHVLGTGYNPQVFEVGPGKAFDPADPAFYPHNQTAVGPIQAAIDAASAVNGLVVIYPTTRVPVTNPLGWYLESLVISAPVMIQGVGPGGVYADQSSVPGTILDGRGMGGDNQFTLVWEELVADIWNNRGGWDRTLAPVGERGIVPEGSVITILANEGEFTLTQNLLIDGMTIQGGDQQGFPNNRNQAGGTPTGQTPIVVVQGGAIFANGHVDYMKISNNVIQSNGGAYGAIRLGTPNVSAPYGADNFNDNVKIVNNRILSNGGTNLAGGVGVFAGADNYEVAYNDICGNFSAEYGGGISHYGFSPGGKIHNNRIYFNTSYDEGGGIMLAGELPADPNALSPGTGPVDVYANLIQSNLSNDDGGGLRFLMAGNFPFHVYNNMIVNNVSTHEGGGISLNDAPDTRIYNNTIMKNITTATAMTSNGLPAPAGIATARNSNLLQATLPAAAPVFSDPILFNNILWDNRAGAWLGIGSGVVGIGIQGDPTPVYNWDMGVSDNAGKLSPTTSLLQSGGGVLPHASNIMGADPLVKAMFDTSVRVLPWRGNGNFIGANIVALDVPVSLMGDYHLTETSPANGTGVASKIVGSLEIFAPNRDIDDYGRPSYGLWEIGADELFEFILSYYPLIMR